MSTIHLKTIKPDSENLEQKIKEVFLQATNNLEWLSPGDTVLLKPALNSSDPYPATTHPQSVHAIAKILIEKGAKVIIGDQSGIEHVVQDDQKIVKGSSEDCYNQSGMNLNKNVSFIAFEKQGWDKGFHHFQSPKTKSWPHGFYITNWINKVDHIINLPRLSTHIVTGVTLGLKNLVGLLREDSRIDMHANGKMKSVLQDMIKGSSLKIKDDNKNSLIEKIVEISLAIKDKLRLTLFTATEAQLALGPDKKVINWLNTYSKKLNPGYVFASPDILACEIFAIALMTHLYKTQVPFSKKLIQKFTILVTREYKELGQQSIWENRFIKHALKLGLGERNFELKDVGECNPNVKNEVISWLRANLK